MNKTICIVIGLLLFVTTGYCQNDNFIIKEINLEMIKCPAGGFMMGSPKEELKRDSFENLHKVTISKDFYIGTYEITQKQYKSIVGQNPSYFKNPNSPVENVSWKDANNFCDKLNSKYKDLLPENYKFALPTEAQWEYACRAGTTTTFNNGKNLSKEYGHCPNLDEVAWYSGNSSYPVGMKKPNSWGIFDMHGNVFEWCRDGYREYPNGEVIDPIGEIDSSDRILRGGSWRNHTGNCRSAYRFSANIDECSEYYGFRIALVVIE